MAREGHSGSRPLLWAGLLGVALLGLGLFAVYGIEWVEQEIDLGYGDEALRNRYLAAERFLREQGVEAETVAGMRILDGLPPAGDVLIITSTRRAMSERRVERLSRWVEAGGHLVVVASEHYDEETGSSQDPLLDRYGIHLVHVVEDVGEKDESGEVEDESEAWSTADDEEARGEPEAQGSPKDEIEQTVDDILQEALSGELPACQEGEERLAVFFSSGAEHRLVLELGDEHHLASASGAAETTGVGAIGERGVQLVQLPVGQGRLTAATSLSIWLNHRIHCRDHAYALWLLTEQADKVWLLHDPEIPSLAALLGANLPLTCAGFTALLVLWGAAASLRFGPTTPGAGAPRRELLEHLEASAHFLWRRRLMSGALDELREEITQRAAAQHRAWPALDASRRLLHLAELAGRSEEDVRDAFTGEAPTTRRELVQTMQTLQSIRRKL